jgi:uncharacterized membrane protein
MFYAALKAIHLLSLIAWVGGMFFAVVCLRPALSVLEGPLRLKLMDQVFQRFFAIVHAAIGLMVLSGAWMLYLAIRVAVTPGLHFNMPLDWYAMIGLGIVMIAIFGRIRFGAVQAFAARGSGSGLAGRCGSDERDSQVGDRQSGDRRGRGRGDADGRGGVMHQAFVN